MISTIKSILKKLAYSFKRNPFHDQKLFFTTAKGLIIFDIGAHHGETAIKYNRTFKDCDIYSFEPFSESFDILNEKVAGYDKIKTFKSAIGNINGAVDFHVNKYSDTNSVLSTHSEASHIWGNDILDTLKTIKVDCITLDNFFAELGIFQIDILKIDTQGNEFAVLEGAIKNLEKDFIKLIYLEIITLPTYESQKHFDEILLFLRLHNFDLYNLYNLSFTKFGELRQMDAIFLNKKFRFELMDIK